MNTELRVYINEQMNMVRHNLHFNKFNSKLRTHEGYKFPKTCLNFIDENLAAVFRTPHDMILTRIDYIMIRFILHECIIQKNGK